MTQVVREAIAKRVEEAKEHLVVSDNPEFDRIVKGMVRAYIEFLDPEPLIELEAIEEIAENEV